VKQEAVLTPSIEVTARAVFIRGLSEVEKFGDIQKHLIVFIPSPFFLSASLWLLVHDARR
jgi:hypothetical protein